MKSIGIDIGSTSIKIAELEQNNKGLHLTHYSEKMLGENPTVDRDLEILEYLRSVAPQFTGEDLKICVALPQEKVSVRNKVFPFNDKNKILKSLPFELEDELPFDVSNAIYDAKIIRYMGSSTEVLACVTPKNKIEEILSKMKDRGLDISLLSAEGTALANCWENWDASPVSDPTTSLQLEEEPRESRDIQIHVHIGHLKTIVCAFSGKSLVGVRSIFWGGINIAEAIQAKYEVPLVEAIKILKERSFILLNHDNAAYDQIVFSNIISDSVSELARDLKMTFLEFKSEFNGHVLGLKLTGGTSNIPNIHAHLTQMLEVPVNIGSCEASIQFQAETNQFFPSLSPVAIGLALEGLRKPRNPAINFLKGEFQKQNLKFEKIWLKWGSLAQTAAILFIAFFVYSIIRDQMSSSLNETVSESLKIQATKVAHLNKKQSNETGLKKFLNEQKKKIKEIKNLENVMKYNSPLDIVKNISDIVPSKNSISLKVEKIRILNNKVEVEGTVSKNQELQSLQSSLSQLARNGKLEIIPKPAASGFGVPFAYKFEVDRGLDKLKTK